MVNNDVAGVTKVFRMYSVSECCTHIQTDAVTGMVTFWDNYFLWNNAIRST